MKKNILFLATLLLVIVLPYIAKSGNPPVVKWTVKNPFEQKVFIENKGQYEINGKVQSKDILFSARQGGLLYYFTNNAIWIKKPRMVIRKGSQIKISANDTIEQFHQIEFVNANSQAQVIGEGNLRWYSNFRTHNGSVKAQAYKKLIYLNLYPGIDMEFYFPQDSAGFEYSFIVHPGADVSQIKINYPLGKTIELTLEKNLTVQSSFGKFTDMAPAAKQAGSYINCSMVYDGNDVHFNVANYDKTQTLVIDPWEVTPSFIGGNNSGFDIDWDNAGNCYVYGGGYETLNVSWYPYQLMKFDPSGNLLWTYTTDFSSTDGDQYLGDFAVDKSSQSVYIGEGFNKGGAEMVKLNSVGKVIDSSGNTNMIEMWRIAFSRCTQHEAVIGGGNIVNTNYNSAIAITPADSDLSNLNAVNVLNTNSYYHDVCLLTLDDTGNVYMSYCSNSQGNIVIKSPISSLTTIDWNKSDNYNFLVANSVLYGFGNGGDKTPPNGFNGMTVSNNVLYTYDSYTLQQWNTSTGAITIKKTVNTPKVNNQSIYWGGLTSDDCGNIFAGSTTYINQYNSSLNLVNTYSLPDTVYDVKLGNNNILYVCGINFITAIQVRLSSCNSIGSNLQITNHIVNAGCSAGSDSISISGGVPPYYVTWNTSPVQTGFKATNLSPGVYVATVGSSSCLASVFYDTVRIIGNPLNVQPQSPIVCNGQSVKLKIKSKGSDFIWSPSTGLNTTTGDSVIASPTVSTVYFIVGKDSLGCDASASDTLYVPSTVLRVTPQSTMICKGASITLKVTSEGTDFTWSPSTGLNSTTGTSVMATPSASSVYTIKGTDSVGCPITGTDTVRIATGKLYIYPQSPQLCKYDTFELYVPDLTENLVWTPSTGLNKTTGDTVLGSALTTTIYTVTGNDSLGCPSVGTDTVKLAPASFNILPKNPTICSGSTVTLSAQYNSSFSFIWRPTAGLIDSSQSGDSVLAAPTISTVYTLTGQDVFAPSCVVTGTDTVVVSSGSVPLIVQPQSPVVCEGQSITLYVQGGGTGFIWTPQLGLIDSTLSGDTVVAALTGTTVYLVTKLDTLGCSETGTDTVVVKSAPPLIILPQDTSICSGQSVTLYVNGGGVFYTWSPATGLNATIGDSVVASPTVTITYTVLGYDSLGCNVTGADSVTVLPSPNKPTLITGHGDTLFSGSKYHNQWYRDDTLLPGDTSQYIIITCDTCRYCVAVNYGCISDTTCTFTIGGIRQVGLQNSVQLFPNPVNDKEFIKINSSAGDLSNWNLQLTDVLGRVIYKTQSLNYLNQIDMSKIPSGMYFISITNRTGRAVFPLVKQE